MQTARSLQAGPVYGIIERYTRSNGTEDVGIRPVPCLTMNRQLVESIHGLFDVGAYEHLIKKIDIEGTGAIHFVAGRLQRQRTEPPCLISSEWPKNNSK